MTQFDPSEYMPKEGDAGGASDTYLETPGVYSVGFSFAKPLTETKNGNPVKRFKAEVIEGPHKGEVFWPEIFFSTGALTRLGALCSAMGARERFDIESDAAIEKALLHKPFRAKIKVDVYDGKRYAKIAFLEMDVTPSQRRAMDEWTIAAVGRSSARMAAKGLPTDERLPDDDLIDDDIPF